MNNEFENVGLYNHNIISYQKIREAFRKENVVGIVHATGTGKSYNALELAYENKDKKIIYVVPSNGIIEHLNKIILDNPNLDKERDFPNLEFRTYQSFINLSKEEIESLDVDLLILDEFHHLGAPVWGDRINNLIETHPNIKVFGMTAYTVRDRGTIYERDMALSDDKELFSDKIVSRYDLSDAMIDGILPKPIYKSAYINLQDIVGNLENRISKLDRNSGEYREYLEKISNIKKIINKAPSIKDVIKRNIKKNGKYIYFCPPYSEDNVNDINTIISEMKLCLREMGLSENDYVLYETTSSMKSEGTDNRNAFYNDKDLDGEDVKGKLRIMFAINQYNEGVHAPNIDGIIMGRGTTSDIVYFEQLGRALSVRGDTIDRYKEYEKYSHQELIDLCKERDIKVKDDTEKRDLIEKLVSPLVIDLTNNYEYIKELENNLQDKIKERQKSRPSSAREIKLNDYLFDIEIANQDLFNMLLEVKDKLTNTWEDYYSLAKEYFLYHGNLEIPALFRTNNGYEFDPSGMINLGNWVRNQRKKISPESERGILLKEIGMRFENIRMNFDEFYKYAKKYYEYYGNLDVPYYFKTNDGINYDEKGKVNLGSWIMRQKREINPDSYKGKLLSQIGIKFSKRKMTFEDWYKLAKAYFDYHGNLFVSSNFKTINGYEYDANGKNLGMWLSNTRNRKDKLTDKQISMLDEIGMIYSLLDYKWDKMYNLARVYYEHYGNLQIPHNFITINGYTNNSDGEKLGIWIEVQRRDYKSMAPEKQNKLKAIGLTLEGNHEYLWNSMYNLAKIYYEHFGNLLISNTFKTINGYEYDENGVNLGMWIQNQRNKTLSSERRKLLSDINMVFGSTYDYNWGKMYNLAKIYYEYHGDLKISRSFKTTDGFTYNEKGLALGAWIIDQRNNKNLSEERKQLLLNIGMIFDVINNYNWDKMYNLAKKYYEHYGNLLIKNSFTTINGYDYSEGGIKLGSWVIRQRQSNVLTEEHKEKLKAIGMVFESLDDYNWDYMYNLAKTYYEHFGNLSIPLKFKTINGYEYDLDGKNLGYWIRNQRNSKKLSKEKIIMLTNIGLIWRVKENRNQIEITCINNNIDYEKNKKILSHISIQEFTSKIEYLKNHNMNFIIDSGFLHEMFSMSNIALKEKYNITLEELIYNYYGKNFKRGI